MATYKIEKLESVDNVEETLREVLVFKDLMKLDLPATEDKFVVIRRILHELYQKVNELEVKVNRMK